jgi:hypothetical protein
VALAAAFAAALQFFPGIEDKKELSAVSADVLHTAGGDVAIQKLEGADALVSALQPIKTVFAGFFRRGGKGGVVVH